MKKILLAIIGAFCILVPMCAAESDSSLSIVTTNFICCDLARAVCGNEADITMLISPGMEVHTYDPTPSDILRIADCDLFIFIGGESDAWAEDILSSFGDDGPEVLRLFDCVEALEEETTEEMTAHGSADEEETEYDEHIWTAPENVLKMLSAVEDALEPYGTFCADAYRAEVERIDSQIRTITETGKRDIMVFADRFPLLYFVRAYGLRYKAVFPSCNAESDPAARTVAALIDTVRTEKIPVIYILEMSSARIAHTIAEETGAKICTYYSVQTISKDDFDNGETYISLMDRNIEVLKEGLL